VLGAEELVLGVGELVAGVGAAVLVARWAFPCARRWILALPSDARTSVSTAATAATAHRECLRMPPRSHMYTTMISLNAPGGDAVPCVAASAILSFGACSCRRTGIHFAGTCASVPIPKFASIRSKL